MVVQIARTFVGWNFLAVQSKLDLHLDEAREMAVAYPDHVIKLLDDTGRVLYASDSHLELLGYSVESLIGHNVRQFIAREDIPHSEISIQDAVLTREAIDIRFRHRSADGRYIDMRRKTWALDGDSYSQYYILTRSRCL